MHILTKVFVMLATVLAVALSAMVIAYAVNTDRIQADYNAALAQKSAAEATMATVSGQATTSVTRLQASLQDAENSRSEALSRVRALEAEKASLLTAKNKAESGLQSVQSKIAELSETAKTQANLITNYRDENGVLRGNELKYRERALDMEQRLADLQSQVEVYMQQNRAMQEQLVELQRQAGASGAAAPGGAGGSFNPTPATFTGPKIQGVVQEVQNDAASGRQLVRVSVGTNDRVAKNMKFAIVRGDQFVANLVIMQADFKTSVGYIDANGNRDVRTGDLVMSRVD